MFEPVWKAGGEAANAHHDVWGMWGWDGIPSLPPGMFTSTGGVFGMGEVGELVR